MRINIKVGLQLKVQHLRGTFKMKFKIKSIAFLLLFLLCMNFSFSTILINTDVKDTKVDASKTTPQVDKTKLSFMQKVESYFSGKTKEIDFNLYPNLEKTDVEMQIGKDKEIYTIYKGDDGREYIKQNGYF